MHACFSVCWMIEITPSAPHVRRCHWTRSFLWKEIKPRSKSTTIREAKPLLLIHLNDNMSRTIAGILVLLPFSPSIFWQQDTPKWVFQIRPGACFEWVQQEHWGRLTMQGCVGPSPGQQPWRFSLDTALLNWQGLFTFWKISQRNAS